MSSFAIPKTQKALIFDSVGGPLEVREIPVPEPGPDELLVNIKFSGICHSDLHIWLGEVPILPLPVPIVGGHEGAGVVVKTGANVMNFKVGDKAGIKWINGSCQVCELCKNNYDQNCPSALTSGFKRYGTFQEYALVKASEAPHIPDNVDLARVSPILCAGVTVYRALKESNVQAGQIVAITGAGGGLGSLAIQYAKAMGMRVLAIDMGEKEQHCRKLGAEFFVNPKTEANIVETIVKLTNGGPHGVVNVATSEATIAPAIKYVRTRGTVVLVALPKDAKITADVFNVVIRALTIKGSMIGNRLDADQAIDFFARGLIDIPIEIVALKDVPAIYDRMTKGQVTGRVVVDLSK